MSRLVVLIMLLASLAAPGAMGLSRAAEVRYHLALGVDVNADDACVSTEVVLNAACFDLYPAEKSVVLGVRDDSQRSVAVKYAFKDAQQRVLVTGHFCGSGALLDVPDNARTLVLVLGDPGKVDDKPLPGCQLQRGVGGVVSAVFR